MRRARPAPGRPAPRIGFVATNSVTQGEQAAQLWPTLLGRLRLEIAFAHRTFAWGSDARGMAHVHVVIIGLDAAEQAPADRRLFACDDVKSEPLESRHAVITPYLFDGGGLANPHLVVREEGRPINGLPRLVSGTQPLEDGNLTFSREEMEAFVLREPASRDMFRPFPGAREFIRGSERWILHTGDTPLSKLKSLTLVQERLKRVQMFRGKAKRVTTKRLAPYPSSYGVTVVPDEPFLIIPQVSSERRDYIPIAWLEPPVIPSEKLRVLLGATKPIFALLTSAMHMAWMRAVTGRLESRYMYSVGVVYNTFPLPPVAETEMNSLAPYADRVLGARLNHDDVTLADLYDPTLTPPDLRRAHQKLDRAVDRLYRRAPFATERERVEHLFARYERLQAPLAAEAAVKARSRRRARRSR